MIVAIHNLHNMIVNFIGHNCNHVNLQLLSVLNFVGIFFVTSITALLSEISLTAAIYHLSLLFFQLVEVSREVYEELVNASKTSTSIPESAMHYIKNKVCMIHDGIEGDGVRTTLNPDLSISDTYWMPQVTSQILGNKFHYLNHDYR